MAPAAYTAIQCADAITILSSMDHIRSTLILRKHLKRNKNSILFLYDNNEML